jgi:hypothetical protein
MKNIFIITSFIVEILRLLIYTVLSFLIFNSIKLYLYSSIIFKILNYNIFITFFVCKTEVCNAILKTNLYSQYLLDKKWLYIVDNRISIHLKAYKFM